MKTPTITIDLWQKSIGSHQRLGQRSANCRVCVASPRSYLPKPAQTRQFALPFARLQFLPVALSSEVLFTFVRGLICRMLLTTLALCSWLTLSARAQSGGSFTITKSVVAGGGAQNSTGGSFTAAGTQGQS